MRNFTNIAIFLILFMAFTNSIFSQMTREEKLKLIDQEIAEAESEKTTGIWMVAGGTATQVLGWLLYDPVSTVSYSSYSGSEIDEADNTVSWILIGTGLIVGAWGGYKWWSSVSEVNMLKQKRYDIAIAPYIKQRQNSTFVYGIGLRISF